MYVIEAEVQLSKTIFDAMELYFGHRAKISPPVLLNRIDEFEQEEENTSKSELAFTDEQGTTPTPRKQPGPNADDPNLTESRSRTSKKTRRLPSADSAEVMKDFVGTLTTRWQKEDENDEKRRAEDREVNDRLLSLFSRVTNSLENWNDKNV